MRKAYQLWSDVNPKSLDIEGQTSSKGGGRRRHQISTSVPIRYAPVVESSRAAEATLALRSTLNPMFVAIQACPLSSSTVSEAHIFIYEHLVGLCGENRAD